MDEALTGQHFDQSRNDEEPPPPAGFSKVEDHAQPADVVAAPRRRISLAQRTFSPMDAGSLRGSIMALACTAFGAAILVVPWVFASLGALLGVACLLAAAGANFLSMRLLANAAFMTSENTYADVVRAAVGLRSAQLVECLFFVYTLGCITSNMIFLEEFGTFLVTPLHLPAFLEDQSKLIITLTLIPLMPFALTRTAGALRYVMLLSQLGLAVIIGNMVIGAPAKATELMTNSTMLSRYWWLYPDASLSWQELPQVIAMLFFAFCCHVSLFATYGELAMPTPHRVNKVFSRAVVVQALVYGLIGLCGMISFGPPCKANSVDSNWCTPTNILSSPRMAGGEGLITRIAMALAICVAVPLNVHCGRSVLGRALCKPDVDGSNGLDSSLLLHTLITIMLLGIAVGIATTYKSITDIIGIVGGGCASSFMFTVPLIMTVLLRGRRSALVLQSQQHIGDFLGVTKHGAWLAALLLAPCGIIGYAAAAVSVGSMVSSSKSS